ncbi:uncharacterized protein EV154DRAFT_608140 [Mucor mucedo]|uniref:uncharacterized protein n=1 Tax=Mucor mucedo TaxID=29922 RepID=UPI00221E9D57|nr:uncharacterized protein EV154DRAFT_608140 [Mucor mucedo]KAI7866102.1 hypothetical protein EV154DRAFT_608140 [Mucor mucedo]
MKITLVTFVFKNRIYFDVEVNPMVDKPIVIKKRAETILQIIPGNQDLRYKGVLLEKDQVLGYYGIQDGDEILMETNGMTGTFTISLHNSDGFISHFSVDYYNTVLQIKKLVQTFYGTFISRQCLMFEGKELEESKKLEDYFIGPRSILTLKII